MPTLAQYTNNLPEHILWQILSFHRFVWREDVENMDELLAGKTPLHPPHWQPRYFVLADGEVLISAAAVVQTEIEVQASTYTIFGLSMVMTYPDYRNQGHGSYIVKEATDHIKGQPSADIALLQTAPHLEHFYNQHGWEHTPKIGLLVGNRNKPREDDGWYMMFYLSERARRHHADFEQKPFYFDVHVW